MDFPNATISELLCLAEAVENNDIKKTFHSSIVKRIHDKKFFITDEETKIRFNNLSKHLYNENELFLFSFVTHMLEDNNEFRKRPYSATESESSANEVSKQKHRKINNLENKKTTSNNDLLNDSDETFSIKIEDECIIEDEEVQEFNIESNVQKEITTDDYEDNIEDTNDDSENENSEEGFIENKINSNSRRIKHKSLKCNSPSEHQSSYSNSSIDESENYNANDDISNVKTAFQGKIISFTIKNKHDDLLFINDFLRAIKKIILSSIVNHIHTLIALKFNVTLCVSYSKRSGKLKNIIMKTFIAPTSLCTKSSNNNKMLHETFEHLNNMSEEFQDNGWILEKIEELQININKYNPLRASS